MGLLRLLLLLLLSLLVLFLLLLLLLFCWLLLLLLLSLLPLLLLLLLLLLSFCPQLFAQAVARCWQPACPNRLPHPPTRRYLEFYMRHRWLCCFSCPVSLRLQLLAEAGR